MTSKAPAKAEPRPCGRFVGYAACLTALFLVAHVAGLRRYTAALSGTGGPGDWRDFCGAVYAMLYFCLVGVVPILLIAAALVKTWLGLTRPRRPQS